MMERNRITLSIPGEVVPQARPRAYARYGKACVYERQECADFKEKVRKCARTVWKEEKIEKPAVTQKAGDPEKAPSAPVVMRISPWGEADLFPCARLCAREMEMKVDALRKLIRNGDADSFGYTYDYALEAF